MSFYQFTKNDNKSIIWGLLHEGGVFKDLPNTQLENVKKQFENTILSMKPEFDLFFEQNDEGDEDYEQKASEMITNSNKAVIRKMVEQISSLKVKRSIDIRQSQSQQQQQPVQRVQEVNLPVPPRFGGNTAIMGVPSKKPKIEEIYRADDLQKTRMSELEIRLKEKQTEMDNMLNNKKPEQIDFTDKSLTDDKLSSNEMERLLEEALSSRQRELEKIAQNDNAKIPESIASSVRAAPPKRPQESVKKNVSFNDNDNEKIIYSNETSIENEENEVNNSMDTDFNTNTSTNGLSFLSKLKKTSTDALNDTREKSNTKFLYNTTPLDEIMSISGMDDNEYVNLETRIFERYKTGETTESGEYHKINEKINIIQNEIQDIKRMQDRILSILDSKFN